MLVADLSSYEPLTAPTEGDRARLIAAGLNRLGLAGSTVETGPVAAAAPLMDGGEAVDGRSRRGANMTECVTVPSSEHVAEIVGRQGSASLVFNINPLEGRGRANWLHLAIHGLSYILISDNRALWRSAVSARVPECQKLKM